MALTRKLLKSFGLDDAVIDSIIEAHTESTDALKKQRDDALAEAAKVEALTKDLNEAKDKLAKAGDAAKVQKDFDDYKAGIEAEKKGAKTRDALRALLKDIGIKRDSALDLIMAAEKMDGYELDENGSLKDAENIANTMKQKHSEWIGEVSTTGVPPMNPPSGGATKMTRAEIEKISDGAERRAAILQNMELFE